MKRLINESARKIKVLFKESLRFWRGAPYPASFMHKNVPYFCQWESRELAKDILVEKIKAEDDPNFRSFFLV